MAHDLVTVRIPAKTRYIALARVTAASAAAELDYSIDEVDDLRMAANEIVAIVQELAVEAGIPEIEVRYSLADESIMMVAHAEGVDAVPALDDLTKQILSAVVDDFEVGPGLVSVGKGRAPR